VEAMIRPFLNCITFQANHHPSFVTNDKMTHFSALFNKIQSHFSGIIRLCKHIFLKRHQLRIYADVLGNKMISSEPDTAINSWCKKGVSPAMG